ncbi:hypothetical protein CC78DRAFT_535058 [Lojkania enalia]|uniref:BTB domain-containing protein n=1 Tax=Lojkania enalia TaxID=147567 RepID=A0A9P4K4W6_9PLEO|nr:hypothetical protein CC78DRAFT_535058 [Didymosphaeria enalia]
MGHWQDWLIYYRDFAYNARRLRMANGNISDVPAATYAEYVPGFSDDSNLRSYGACSGAPKVTSLEDARSHALHENVPQVVEDRSGYLGLRPALVHRLHSRNLHVRAKAKLQHDRLLSGPLVDIYVGKSKRHWALHRNLLCHHSEFLESELQGDGGKRVDRLDLPEHEPSGFELLVKWMYQGRLDDVSDFVDSNQKYDYAVSCHKLYLLCERFNMPQLKNVAMDQYRKGLNEAQLVPDADEINEIYRKSPVGSPFRRLMTKIAARQIMDPGSERNIETYRECFEGNPEFAIDLVNAIKLGTGGMLFDDPTDVGNECDYHDHEAGPNCHIKGKSKVKQAIKTSARLRDPKFFKSEPSACPGPRPLPPHQPLQAQSPPLLPRQARRQDGMAAGPGPLRRRLTSPASSTVETSTENATATAPSPKELKDKLRKVTPPQQPPPSPALDDGSQELHQAHGDRPPSSSGESRQPLDSSASDTSDKGGTLKPIAEDTSPRRGIWDWARVGTGKLGIISRMPHPAIMTSKAANTAVSGALEGTRTAQTLGSFDDFSVPSMTSSNPENGALQQEVAAAKIESLGISNSTVDTGLVDPNSFAQTKGSSDDLVAGSTHGTPSPRAMREDDTSVPLTPSPQPRKKEPRDGSESTLSPQRIPKYKIALTSDILSPSRTPTS